MKQDRPRIYLDRVIPLAYLKFAREKAIAENPVNASPFEVAALRSRRWRPGRRLRVRFLDGAPEVCAKVERYAKQWTQYAHIDFIFGNYVDAEIRISFSEKGSWSALGTDALVEAYFPQDAPTMNYGWLDSDSPESDYSVCLHEFGHALGLIHEHQSPSSGILWNRQSVIQDLSGPPNNWDIPTIEHNVLNRYSATVTQYTTFDPQSIMVYPIPKHWTLNGYEVMPNNNLSHADIDFIRSFYPGR